MAHYVCGPVDTLYDMMNDSQVLGMGEEWKGGDIANSPGGAFKINLLRKEMENHKDDADLIVLFSDSYDVVAVGR